MKHTKGELEIHERPGHAIDGTRQVLIAKDTGDRIAVVSQQGVSTIEESIANAERLVLCWNSHDDLLDALKMAEKVIDSYYIAESMGGEYEVVKKTIQQVLAKAKE